MDTILKELFGDQEGVLSESAQQQITTAFNTKVDELVEEKVELALETQDKSNTEMLQLVVEKYEEKIKKEKDLLAESLDTEHADKAKEAFDLVEKDRTKKLVQVKESYEQLLSESVKTETRRIVDCVDKYFDTFLESHVPHEMIAEAAKRDYSGELLGKITRLISIDETISEDVKRGMKDAQKTIAEKDAQISQLQMKDFLREKTEHLPMLEQKFLVESLANKSIDYAERNFDYTRQLFSKSQEPSRVVMEKTTASNVDRPVKVVEEATKKVVEEANQANSAMAVWANKSKSLGTLDSWSK